MKCAVCLISLTLGLGGCASTPPTVPVLGGPCVYVPFTGRTNEELAKYVLELRDTIRQCESNRRANDEVP
jgi:hypothetical protein